MKGRRVFREAGGGTNLKKEGHSSEKRMFLIE